MENSKIKEGKMVRAYAFPKESPNAFLFVNRIYPTTGEIWASNLNIGGNINKVFSKEHFNKLISI